MANETCSRVAVVNYQKVLVDAGAGKKGEGLRFYLKKDETSQKLLDEYQEKSKPTVYSASASTIGSLMIVAGLIQTDDSQSIASSNTLIFGGATLAALSYLISKTVQRSNEKILKEAVDHYNKRNSPRIYFSPFKDNNGSAIDIGVSQEF